MAEALCGPSNPIQSFQKHTSIDRTLQQDRLATRQLSTQGFRTQSPSAGILDAEFQAFQASQPINTLDRSPLGFQRSHAAPLTPSAQQNLSGWASDFQRLNIAGPRDPLSGIQARDFGQSRQGGWHQEFLAQGNIKSQHDGVSMRSSGFTQRSFERNDYPQVYQPMSSQISAPSWHPGINQSPSFQSSTMQPQSHEHMSNFNEAAFEQAFDDASAAVQEPGVDKGKAKMDDVTQPTFNMSFACTDPGDVMGGYNFDHQRTVTSLDAHVASQMDNSWNLHAAKKDLGVHETEPTSGLPKIGSDTIPAHSGLAPETESDELARTAGQLLDSLKDEQNTKFQQSNFLSLMRQLRDKEARIEGDKVIAASQDIEIDSSHPGGPKYPFDAFS